MQSKKLKITVATMAMTGMLITGARKTFAEKEQINQVQATIVTELAELIVPPNTSSDTVLGGKVLSLANVVVTPQVLGTSHFLKADAMGDFSLEIFHQRVGSQIVGYQWLSLDNISPNTTITVQVPEGDSNEPEQPGEWKSGDIYKINDRTIYNGKVYEALREHRSEVFLAPDSRIDQIWGFWKVINE